jgi:hypothetical protein
MDPVGFDETTWRAVKVFTGRTATPADVATGAAIFALGDTENGEAFDDPLPQPAIWYDDEDQHAVVIIQAEVHETPDGDRLEVLGLLLPNGETKVGFTEDVEEVDPAEPAWLALIEVAKADADLDAANDDDPDDDA